MGRRFAKQKKGSKHVRSTLAIVVRLFGTTSRKGAAQFGEDFPYHGAVVVTGRDATSTAIYARFSFSRPNFLSDLVPPAKTLDIECFSMFRLSMYNG